MKMSANIVHHLPELMKSFGKILVVEGTILRLRGAIYLDSSSFELPGRSYLSCSRSDGSLLGQERI